MVGSKIKHDRKGDHDERPRRTKRSTFAKYLLAPVVAVSVLLGGNNINDLGINSVMAQPATRRRGATRAEPEEVAGLQQRARDAATAYQNYILTGNEADYTRYRELITAEFHDQPVTENREFMEELHTRMTAMRSDPQVSPILQAYEADLDHVIGIRMEPSVMEDFITKVREIRTRLAANATTWALVDALVQRVERAGETEVPAESEIGRFRAYRRAHSDATAEDAARHVIESPGLREIRERHGENLTNLLAGELPNQQATRCVEALRNFMLTGDTAHRDEFRRIFGAHSPSGEFWTGFQRLFLERITRDQVGGQPSPISQVYRSYYAHHNNQVDPEEFATAISQMYEAASTGDVSRLQSLRQAHGNETVDRFVDIIALGLARRCATLMERVLETGSTTARDEFIRIYSGNFVSAEGEIGSRTYTQVALERNDTFFNEFVRLYRAQIQGNTTVSSIEMNFRRNVRSIAVRDIYTELLRTPPDMDRLRAAYSPELIELVAARRPTWMIRTASDLNRVLTDRAREEDRHARRISSMTIRVQAGETLDRGAALADVYGQLAAERLAIGSVPAGSIISEHYDELSWLGGTPEEVQAELDRRSAPGRGEESDEVAVQLKALFPQDGGATLSTAYAQIRLFRQTRELLATRYGSEFVNYVSQNLDTLHWVVRPVGQIEHEMTTRTSDEFVRAANTTADGGTLSIGYSIGGLARALHAIYAAHGQASPTTEELVAQYGQQAVTFVTQNRANLAWLGGTVASIEQRLLRGQDAQERAALDESAREVQDRMTNEAKQLLFPFTPVQFILSYARGREALARGGLARMDGIDSLGRFFLTPVASREAGRSRGISGEALEGSLGEITANSRTIERDLESMRRQLEDPMLAPARPLLEERINRWEAESRRIRLAAGGADQAEMQTLLEEQRALQESMISATELRRSIELAFSMIHLAETGGDLSRTAGTIDGFAETIAGSSDVGSLRSAMAWYNGITNTDKQAVIGDVIFAVMGRADPELRAFISSMGDRGFSRDLGTAYNAITRGSGNVADVQRRHGTEFVRLINDHRSVLGFLENLSGTSEQNLSMGQNVLFANIVIRVYRAVSRPDGTETRERMIELYGERFVRAVERQREHLGPLAESRAGLEEVTALPESVRQSLYRAYPQAYTRVVTALHRAYRQQDEQLLYALGSVYGALNSPESEERTARVAGLRQIYGAAFVQMVERNRARLRFLENLSTSDVEHLREVDAEVLEQLHRSFEAGDGVARGEFMQNFRHVAEVLPGVYSRIRGTLVYANATDDLGANLTLAINHYRDQFGSNDYLFRNFINMELLNSQLQTLARRYSITLPPGVAENGLRTPEEFAAFLSTESGQDLITAGRDFYTRLETTYLQARRDSGMAADAEDARGFTEAEASNLRNQLSIIDALYLGVGLGRVGSLGSEFGTNAARATMNSLLLINQRDPYLVGPFILQVLPAIISVAQDERTLVAGIEAFNTIFAQRYGAAGANLSYSTHINREYFLQVFARIAQRLPSVTTTYDHNQMEDELRRVPERQLMEGPWNPQGYRYRPHFLQMEGMEPLPQLFGQAAQPWNLIPSPTMPRSFVEPPGQYGIDSGAQEYFSRMYDMLHPTLGRYMIHGVPQRYRIGALGASTIIREITRLFGEMPVDYSSYWLRHDWQLGGYYGHEQSIPTVADPDTTSTDVAAAGGIGHGRTITGGVRGRGVVRHRRTTVDSEEDGESGSAETDVDVEAQAGGLPVGVAGIIPVAFGQGAGLQTGNLRFQYEGADETTEEQGEVQTRERYQGTLETYSRIARESGGDMLVIVGGEHAPELRAPVPEGSPEGTVGALHQDERSQLNTRLFYIDGSTGNVYDLAYGLDTHAQILNYLYGGTDTRNFLAGVRFAGRNMAPAPALSSAERSRLIERHLGLSVEQQAQVGEAEIERQAREAGVWDEINGSAFAAGFDGAAVGFTIPTGDDADTSTTLMLGQIVRNMGTMDPQHAEEAVGQAVTRILTDGRARDIYAGFYRGAQILEMDPEDSTRVADSRWAEGSGEFMWRRMAIAPRQASMEFRAVGGYPLTAGARWRYERQTGAHRSYGHGITAGYTEIDLLREFRVADQESQDIFATMSNVLVNMYGWGEDEARDTGWLVAGTYMYGRMEGWQGEAEDQPETPNEHYASLLMAYWARRHGILAGVQRVPGFSRLYDRIDRAMLDIQQNPTNEEAILQGLASSLQSDFTSDIWRFALGYGYDGESVRVYLISTGQWTDDETAYANLYGMFVFGRPARAYVDLLGHGYTHSSIMIVEDPEATGGFQVERSERANPYLDTYLGFGVLDWPAVELSRYERNITVYRTSDHPAAARDAYIRLGSVAYSHDRMDRVYGQGFADVIHEQRGNDLEWMIRPVAQVRAELQRRVDEDEDPLAMLISSRRSSETAEAIVDIYRELRRRQPNRERIATEYGEELVQIIENNVHALDWVLKSPEDVATEFVRRAGTSGSVEAQLSETNIRQPPPRGDLTGPEVRRLIEQNIRPCLAGALNSHGRQQAERYDVIYGSHLNAEIEAGSPERRSRYFVMVTRIGTGPNSRGSIMIGTQEDLDEWEAAGNYIGHGVSRLDISPEGDNYEFTFSGDRRLRAFTALRFMGGLTIPLTEDAAEGYRPGGNWTVGALAHVLQDHRQDLLAGILYGQRTYGSEQWTNWQVGLSHRLQLLNTERMSEQLYSYVFFNQTTRQVVFASGDVFENADEMAQVCSQLSGGECSDLNELQRSTAGVGLTWARTNITTGETLSLHFFFEGGVDRRRMLEDASESGQPDASELHPQAEYQRYFVARGGLGVSYERQDPGSSDPGIVISGSIMGFSGSWPTAPGSVTSPEQLGPWAGQEETVTGIMNAPLGWGLGGALRFMW